MSKIGKKPIEIPEGVEVIQNGNVFKIKGPLGENEFILHPKVKSVRDGNQIIISIENESKLTKALWGTMRALLSNKIQGVLSGFQRDLILEGLGFTAEVIGDNISFKLGYTHPVLFPILKTVKVEIKPQRGSYIISIKGIDKAEVGKFAGKIRKIKKAEPYKGKGFRYSDEKIKRKSVKKLGA